MPVQVEDRLSGPWTGVDDDTVIRQALGCSNLGHELEHSLRLLGGELADLVKRRDVPLGQDEEVRRRLRVDVADGDEALRRGDVVAFAVERAEEAVVRQRGSPPPRRRRRARA
jgi:hypothetical protein